MSETLPRIIDAVKAPTDLHALNNEELGIVASEIREQIVTTCSKTGGHIASSLGAVDIIVALHAELNCPSDRIVFDVGHQAYAHKILTGRLKRFDTLRQAGGISGFTNPTENPYDVHWSGHASDGLSMAMGLAKARDARGGSENIVTVIGDASASGGMALEALNHIGQDQTRMVIVLNDNGMSISPSVGAIARHLGDLRTTAEWRRTRAAVLGRTAGIGPAHALMRSAESSFRSLLLSEGVMLFEQLGITCLAPVDGNDIGALRAAIRKALLAPGPVLVHAITKKGKGYGPAELNPQAFHGAGPFDLKTGASKPSSYGYSNLMADTLTAETESGMDIVAITAAMSKGTGLSDFGEAYPDRLIDVGICEEHALGLAAGLATGGQRPVVAMYSTFMQRALDQIIIDIALPTLDVVLCVDRAGVVGEDGPTHTGAFDLAYLRMIPHMRIVAPSSAHELASALHTAFAFGGPFAIRYPREACEPLCMVDKPKILRPGVSKCVRKGSDIAILALGSMVAPSLDAAEILEEQGISARVVDMRWAKPLDVSAICEAAQTELVVCVEEGCIKGGVGEGVLGVFARSGLAVPALTLGLADRFVAQGTREEVLHAIGLDGEGIARSILKRLRKHRAERA